MNSCIFCSESIKSKNVLKNTPLENNEYYILEDLYPSAEKHYLIIPYKHHEDYVNCSATVLFEAYKLALLFAELEPSKRLRENYSIKFNYTTDEQTQRILATPVRLSEKEIVTSEDKMKAQSAFCSPKIHYYLEDFRQKVRHAHLHLMMGCTRNWHPEEF